MRQPGECRQAPFFASLHHSSACQGFARIPEAEAQNLRPQLLTATPFIHFLREKLFGLDVSVPLTESPYLG